MFGFVVVICFVVSFVIVCETIGIVVVIAFVFTAAGWPLVLSSVKSIFGAGMADLVAQFSFLSHFEAAQRGVLEFRAVLFFLGFMALWTILNGLWASRQRLG